MSQHNRVRLKSLPAPLPGKGFVSAPRPQRQRPHDGLLLLELRYRVDARRSRSSLWPYHPMHEVRIV
jgi:hypothetical protein